MTDYITQGNCRIPAGKSALPLLETSLEMLSESMHLDHLGATRTSTALLWHMGMYNVSKDLSDEESVTVCNIVLEFARTLNPNHIPVFGLGFSWRTEESDLVLTECDESIDLETAASFAQIAMKNLSCQQAINFDYTITAHGGRSSRPESGRISISSEAIDWS